MSDLNCINRHLKAVPIALLKIGVPISEQIKRHRVDAVSSAILIHIDLTRKENLTEQSKDLRPEHDRDHESDQCGNQYNKDFDLIASRDLANLHFDFSFPIRSIVLY